MNRQQNSTISVYLNIDTILMASLSLADGSNLRSVNKSSMDSVYLFSIAFIKLPNVINICFNIYNLYKS